MVAVADVVNVDEVEPDVSIMVQRADTLWFPGTDEGDGDLSPQDFPLVLGLLFP